MMITVRRLRPLSAVILVVALLLLQQQQWIHVTVTAFSSFGSCCGCSIQAKRHQKSIHNFPTSTLTASCASSSSPSSSSSSSSSLSKLSAFLWFGGDDSDKDEKQAQQSNNNNNSNNSNATAIAASLASISNVMDAKLGSFKASQRVGDKTGAALADLANTVVEASSDNGKVKVTMTGQQVPVSVQIDESYFQELCSGKGGNNQNNNAATAAAAAAVQELNLQITTAMKSAHDKSGQKLQDKLKVLYQDLGFS